MAACIDNYDDNVWELIALYVDLFPANHPQLFQHSAYALTMALTDLDEVEFRAHF